MRQVISRARLARGTLKAYLNNKVVVVVVGKEEERRRRRGLM